MAAQVATWLAAIEESGLAAVVKQSTWLYPAAELVHIIGFVLLVGAAAMFDLRLLGLSRGVPVSAMASHLLPWARAGFVLLIPTGVLMFVNDPVTTAANPAFRIKMALIVGGLLNVLVFHWGVFRSVGHWDRMTAAPLAARVAAALSLVIWLATLAAGRLMAYV